MGSKPAGRELDAEVAVACFGWTWVREDAEQPDAVPYIIGPRSEADPYHKVWYPKLSAAHGHRPRMGGNMPDYSTDILTALTLLDTIPPEREVFIHRQGDAAPPEVQGTWRIVIEGGGDPVEEASLPLALALAALAAARKATGGGTKDGQ